MRPMYWDSEKEIKWMRDVDVVVGKMPDGNNVYALDCEVESRTVVRSTTEFVWNADQGTIAWPERSQSECSVLILPEGATLTERYSSRRGLEVILPDGVEVTVVPGQKEVGGIFFQGEERPVRWGRTPESIRQMVEIVEPFRRFRCVGEDPTDVAAWEAKQAAREERRRQRTPA